jgi:hypothetical protein
MKEAFNTVILSLLGIVEVLLLFLKMEISKVLELLVFTLDKQEEELKLGLF